MKRIEVAVGVLCNADNKVLIGQRTVQDSYYQKWEFPGGKIEAGETPQEALQRELREEIGIEIDLTSSKELLTLEYDYPDRQVRLHVQRVENYTGEPKGAEGQAVEWVTLQELAAKDVLASVAPIVDALREQLPIHADLTA